jgi:hypothetical protein
MAPPGGQARIHRLAAAAESDREFMERATVSPYRTYGHAVTQRGDAAMAE